MSNRGMTDRAETDINSIRDTDTKAVRDNGADTHGRGTDQPTRPSVRTTIARDRAHREARQDSLLRDNSRQSDGQHVEKQSGMNRDHHSEQDRARMLNRWTESRQKSEIRETIEGEFIPRLMLSHRLDEKTSSTAYEDHRRRQIGKNDIDAFIKLVLADTSVEANFFIETLISRGVEQDLIYTDLFAVCARLLGEMWERDECSFAEVTLGLCRLHELLRERGSAYDVGMSDEGGHHSILLATLGGDQHIFGVAIVAEFFRRAQWRVQCVPGSDCEELMRYIDEHDVDVLGLSLSGICAPLTIREQLRNLRKASRNRVLRILVGGPQIADNPSLAQEIGADDWSTNARMAPAKAAGMIAGNRRLC